MIAKKTVLVLGLALCALSLAMVWVLPLQSLQAQTVSEQKWCNTYLAAEWLPGSELQLPPHQSRSDALKIKYGKRLLVKQYDSSDAWKWWFDIVAAPDNARNKMVVYFYALSDITGDSMNTIFEGISSATGRKRPLFAMAVNPRVLNRWGIQVSDSENIDLLAAPVRWNSDLATTMRAAVDGYSINPARARGSLAHLISYTVASAVGYNPDSETCNPAHLPDMARSAFSADAATLSGTYFGTSRQIPGLTAVATRAVMTKSDWPTED